MMKTLGVDVLDIYLDKELGRKDEHLQHFDCYRKKHIFNIIRLDVWKQLEIQPVSYERTKRKKKELPQKFKHKDNTVSSFSFLRSLCLIGTLVGPSLYYSCTHAHMRTPDLRKHSLQSPCLLPPTAPKPRGNQRPCVVVLSGPCFFSFLLPSLLRLFSPSLPLRQPVFVNLIQGRDGEAG